MKHILFGLTLIAGILGLWGLSFAASYSGIIYDTPGTNDIYGNPDTYDVYAMTADYYSDGDQDYLKVVILTDYETSKDDQTTYGDLFISIDGNNGWDYAFDVSNSTLYNISSASDQNILTAYEYSDQYKYNWDTAGYRPDAVVLVVPDPDGDGNISPLVSISDNSDGSTVVHASATNSTLYQYTYTMTINVTKVDNFDPTQLYLYWTMTCGNDIIEGTPEAVPVPTSICLLGLGLALVISRRRTF